MKRFFLALTVLLPTAVTSSFAQKKEIKEANIFPGKEWLDNNEKHINTHSGGILFFNGVYYWHGEYKIEGKAEGAADGGIICYTSTDLINWNDAGVVLSVDYDHTKSDIAYGCILERPKIVFNNKTKKFVAFFKLYLKGDGYKTAYVGVATASSPLGPFTYSHKFLACGSVNGSGDFAMYKDEDGNLYDLAVRKPDKYMCIARMSDDYMLPATDYTLMPNITRGTEAPAIIKRNGVYHLIGSASTGWAPNTARYFTSKSLKGPWTKEENPLEGVNPANGLDKEKTFGGQSTFIFPVRVLKDAYIIMFDIWKPENASEGGYIWLPLIFKNNQLSIKWMDEWNLGVFKK